MIQNDRSNIKAKKKTKLSNITLHTKSKSQIV